MTEYFTIFGKATFAALILLVIFKIGHWVLWLNMENYRNEVFRDKIIRRVTTLEDRANYLERVENMAKRKDK